MSANGLQVSFMHPRGSGSTSVNLSPDCSGLKAKTGLVAMKFLDGNPFDYKLTLRRTDQPINDNDSFGAVGAQDNDVVSVTTTTPGARGEA
ncbi:MAG: hypothetical protein V1809_03935 [Planctomycetota bacterium]